MRTSLLSLAVAAVQVGSAVAGHGHQHFHKRAPVTLNDALEGAPSIQHSSTSSSTSSASPPSSSADAPKVSGANFAEQKAPSLPSVAAAPSPVAASAPVDASRLLSGLGMKSVATNSKTPNGHCWIGNDGPNTNELKNGSGEDIAVVVWGPAGSWMTDASKSPSISVGIAKGQSVTISCGDVTGGYAAVYGDTKLSSWGQIDNTWVEFTYGAFGTVDVSREVNMNGRSVSVVGPKCTTDMNTCVFVCKSGTSCLDAGSYELRNCNTGNGGHGSSDGMNGGCLMGTNAKLVTTFS